MENILFGVFPDDRFIDFGLYQFGWEQCLPSKSFGPSKRNHYLFHFVISGTGTLYSDDSNGISHEYHIKSNQGFLISPNQVNHYIADEKHPWEYVWIEFDGLRAKEHLTLSGLTYDSPIYRSSDKIYADELKKEMLYLANHPNGSPLNLIGHLYLALDYLYLSSAGKSDIKKGKLADFYVHEAISFIEQNFQNDITIEDISAFCNLNRSYFGKVFQNTMGTSPQTFLINYRMRKAVELLKLTDLPIGDIGNAVGYPNQLHFSRAFKNVYNMPPKQWRIANRVHLKKD